MTKLLSSHLFETDELTELLIKNLPARIKGGNEKHSANFVEYPTVFALKQCAFINFNTRERISWMVFDIDTFENKTALEHFKSIEGFLDYLGETIGLEPTFITQTAKGFHFAYHLKNHIYTHQPKALEYLKAIKHTLTELLGCDEKASHRLNGIWRNPLKHIHYYSGQFNYELSDFKGLLPKKTITPKTYTPKPKIDPSELIEGNRNDALFRYAMRYAKGKSATSPADITNHLIEINAQANKPLDIGELYTIASSVYNYWTEGKIQFGTLAPQNTQHINEGVMNFPKMMFLPFSEYQAEVKRRQRLSAIRTNQIKNKDTAQTQLQNAQKQSALKRKERTKEKIEKAIAELNSRGEKITTSAISKIAEVDRKTVGKNIIGIKSCAVIV